MIEGNIRAQSTSNEMVFANNNNNNNNNSDKENIKLRNDSSSTRQKSPQRQGVRPLSTINGPITNQMSPHRKNLPTIPDRKHSPPLDEYRHRYPSLFRVSSEDSDDSNFDDDWDEVGRMMPGVLNEGTAYTVKETLIQGYIEKKGSGFDWIGSRAWKKRWAVLVKARTDGHDVDVPLLQIFWDYHSPTPSTVISLDSAVLLPENNLDAAKSSNHPYRFQIRHVKKSVNEISVQLTRILGCSEQEQRDEWVYAINQALLEYEKEKANARKLLNSLSVSPPRGRSWAKNDDVMPLPNKSHKRPSPPRIPLSARKL